MSEVILSTLSGDTSVVDGVNRTMMIAAETTCAAAIMFPFRNTVKDNVIDRALFGTTATMCADVAVDGELLVAYHEAVEVGPDDVTECPRCQPQRQLTVVRLALIDHFYKSVKIFLCL